MNDTTAEGLDTGSASAPPYSTRKSGERLDRVVLRPIRAHHAFEACVEQLAIAIRLGIYPPGSYVRLANDEVAVVVRRGRRANAPLAFSIVGRQGLPMGEPALRDTLERAYEVKASVPAEEIKVVVNAAKLLSRV